MPSVMGQPDQLCGLVAPLPLAVRAALRTATLEHARSERRTLFPAILHVGSPGAFRVSVPTGEVPSDFGTRVELIHAMVRRAESAGVSTPTGRPWVWLTRSGENVSDDLDLAFLGPVIQAFAEVEQPLIYVSVTRRGWHDPRSGLHQTWVRVRAA